MPEFLNPFSGKLPDRKLTLEELLRKSCTVLSNEGSRSPLAELVDCSCNEILPRSGFTHYQYVG